MFVGLASTAGAKVNDFENMCVICGEELKNPRDRQGWAKTRDGFHCPSCVEILKSEPKQSKENNNPAVLGSDKDL